MTPSETLWDYVREEDDDAALAAVVRAVAAGSIDGIDFPTAPAKMMAKIIIKDCERRDAAIADRRGKEAEWKRKQREKKGENVQSCPVDKEKCPVDKEKCPVDKEKCPVDKKDVQWTEVMSTTPTLPPTYPPTYLPSGGGCARARAKEPPTTTIYSEEDYLAKARSEGAAPDEQERFAAYNVARGGTMPPDEAWTRFVAKRRPEESAAATRRKAETAKKAAKETAEDAARRFARPIVERWIREHPDGDEDAFAEDVVYPMDLKTTDPKLYALYNVFRECVA